MELWVKDEFPDFISGWQISGPKCLFFFWAQYSLGYSLSQWLNFKFSGITCLVGKKSLNFYLRAGSIHWVRVYPWVSWFTSLGQWSHLDLVHLRWSPYSQTAPLSWSWDLTNVGPTKSWKLLAGFSLIMAGQQTPRNVPPPEIRPY